VGDIDLDMLREAWQKRAEEKQHKKRMLQKDAMEKAKQAASFIKKSYGASKIYLYGSLAWSHHFDAHSDIDLLVEGLPSRTGTGRCYVTSGRSCLPSLLVSYWLKTLVPAS